MTIEIFDCAQNSPEWDELRRGIVTASEIAAVMAEGRKKGEPSVTRRRYLLKLAAERLGAKPGTSYTNVYMERGHTMEGEARSLYSLMTDEDPQLVGFIRNDDRGCSPDALIGGAGLLEIKTKEPHLQAEVLLANEVPAEHVKQIQGQLWIAEREWLDFVSYWPGLPPFIRRVQRDEPLIKEIAAAVSQFNSELGEATERLRRFGRPQPLKADLEASLIMAG